MTQFLLILGALAGYALFLLVSPTMSCRSCAGWGAKGGRRRSACARCQGTGRQFRLGARAVHHGMVSAYQQAREYRRRRPRG